MAWPLFTARASTGLSASRPDAESSLRYRIQMGKSEIGHHRVSVSPLPNDRLLVQHERRIQVKLLSMPVYDFSLASREVWDKRTLNLHELEASGSENGREFYLTGHAAADGFLAKSLVGSFVAPGDVATTEDYWDAAVLKRTFLIDAVKGKVVKPQVLALANGGWHVEHGKTKAQLRFDGAFMRLADIDKDGHHIQSGGSRRTKTIAKGV